VSHSANFITLGGGFDTSHACIRIMHQPLSCVWKGSSNSPKFGMASPVAEAKASPALEARVSLSSQFGASSGFITLSQAPESMVMDTLFHSSDCSLATGAMQGLLIFVKIPTFP